MKLSKQERESVRMKFGGRCAYCGDLLGERWHCDHVEPVQRNHRYVLGKGFVADGTMIWPERNKLENLFPACPACNIDKHSFDLEYWRTKLQRACDVLMRNNSTYRFALRYGLVTETGAKIEFYFERQEPKA